MLQYKKVLVTTILAIVGTAQLHAANDDISLDLRALYVNYSYDKYWTNGEAFATSIKFGYKKKILDNLEAGIVFGAIEDFGWSDKTKQSMTYIFNRDKESFTILHQAYLKYKVEDNFVQIGRFEFSSPLIDSDDGYLLSNSFEGATASLNYEKFNLQIGHIARMSGTWDAGYDGGTFQSMSRSPWVHKADQQETSQWPNPVTDFHIDDAGISFAGVILKDDTYKIQLWDYYSHEFINTLYAQVDLKLDMFDVALQYNTYDEVGQMKDSLDPRAVIDYSVWGAKVSTTLDDIGFTLAYMGVSDDSSAHLWGSWGGYPFFASGMMVSYFETSLRDASVYSLDSDFKLVDNLSTTVHVGYYDLNKNYTIDTNGNRDAVNGEDYMYTYGISNSYKVDERLSFVLKLAGRTLESDNSSELLRTIIKYSF